MPEERIAWQSGFVQAVESVIRRLRECFPAARLTVATDALLDPGSSYKINRTLELDKIKRQIGRWLLAATATTRRLKPILQEIALNLQKFVPNRSQPRKPQPKPHLSHAYK